MYRLKKWMGPALAVFMVTAVAVTAHAAGEAKGQENVAVVNQTAITRVELDNELGQFKRRIASQGRQIPPEMEGEITDNILDKLIDRELLFQESQKKGVVVSPEEVEGQIDKIKASYPEPAKFQAALAQMNTTEKDVRTLISKALAIRDLIKKEVNQGIQITDDESRKFYDAHPAYFKRPERVKASHILIKQEAGADDAAKAEAKKKIDAARKRLADGEDFATVAKEVSEGPSAPRGGDLGFFGRGQMVKPFEEAAFALEPNAVSDVVTTRFGLHLIKVFEKQSEQNVAYEEAEYQIKANLTKQKQQLAVENYLEKLREAAKIEKKL